MSSNGGSAMLASVLQKRMSQVVAGKVGVTIETGEIMSGRTLKLSSLPGALLDKDDYSVCASLQSKMPCQSNYPIQEGDQVLVAWTFDGEPVVIDRILRADRSGAVKSCGWNNICEDCKKLKEEVSNCNENIKSMSGQIDSLKSKVEDLGSG